MTWLRNWRRQRVIGSTALNRGTWDAVVESLPFIRALGLEERERLARWVILFLREKELHGAGGLQLSDEMRYAIAAQACMLILELDLDYFRGWVEVIVYPDEFVAPRQYVDEAGVVHSHHEALAGEAWLGGPVILSWTDAAPAESEGGVNVVIHEFAHKLDMLNGAADGYPPLHQGMRREAWTAAFEAAYDDFCDRVDAGEETVFDPYAAESPGEFFAVMSEVFFEMPRILRREYPEVYTQLALFYRQDPAARLVRSGRRTGR